MQPFELRNEFLYSHPVSPNHNSGSKSLALTFFFLGIVNNYLFIYLLAHTVLDLFNYMYSLIFLFKLIFLNYKNTLKKLAHIIFL